jgi:hypothetical protein
VNIPVVVTAKDQFGNTDLTFAGGANNVVLGITGPDGTLNGFVATPVSGVATFGSFNVETVGTRTLFAVGGSLLSVPTASSSFTISPAGADHFIFTTQPSNAVAGVSISPAIVVEARDQFDNVATGFTSKGVTLSISSGPGTILSGASATATAGVATFSAVSIDLAGAHTLNAINTVPGDCPACAPGTSASFSITNAAATKLGFIQEPNDAVKNTAISPAVTVAAQDPFGNTVPTFAGTVTISIGANPAPGGTLAGTLTQPFVSGVATFGNLSIDVPNPNYRLLATSSPVLTQRLSALFTITP